MMIIKKIISDLENKINVYWEEYVSTYYLKCNLWSGKFFDDFDLFITEDVTKKDSKGVETHDFDLFKRAF